MVHLIKSRDHCKDLITNGDKPKYIILINIV